MIFADAAADAIYADYADYATFDISLALLRFRFR